MERALELAVARLVAVEEILIAPLVPTEPVEPTRASTVWVMMALGLVPTPPPRRPAVGASAVAVVVLVPLARMLTWLVPWRAPSTSALVVPSAVAVFWEMPMAMPKERERVL